MNLNTDTEEAEKIEETKGVQERKWATRFWSLKSPTGEVFQFWNLMKFIRENRSLFEKEDVEDVPASPYIRRRTGERVINTTTKAHGGLTQLGPKVAPKGENPRLKTLWKNVKAFSWKGWSWHPCSPEEAEVIKQLKIERKRSRSIRKCKETSGRISEVAYGSKWWYLKSPSNEEFRFNNLSDWVKTHSNILPAGTAEWKSYTFFSPKENKNCMKSICIAFAKLRKLRPGVAGQKAVWRGWTWDHEGEARDPLSLNKVAKAPVPDPEPAQAPANKSQETQYFDLPTLIGDRHWILDAQHLKIREVEISKIVITMEKGQPVQVESSFEWMDQPGILANSAEYLLFPSREAILAVL